MATIIGRWRANLRRTFTGNRNSAPTWALNLADGDDVGHFGPDSAAWAVHGSMTTLVAGIRSLLLQSLHPGAMAGVHDFSGYRADPLGRLAGTIRWIFTVTYGDTTAAKAASDRVLSLHERVTGTYTDAAGRTRAYAANDPHLLRWIHLAFTDSFLTAEQSYGAPIPGGADAYVADWAVAGDLMHVPDPPRTLADLRRQLAAYEPELTRNAQVTQALSLLRHPPLPASQRLGYRILFAAAVATLDPIHRQLLGVHTPTLGPVPLPVNAATRLVLAVVRFGLGPEGPAESAARRRRARLRS